MSLSTTKEPSFGRAFFSRRRLAMAPETVAVISIRRSPCRRGSATQKPEDCCQVKPEPLRHPLVQEREVVELLKVLSERAQAAGQREWPHTHRFRPERACATRRSRRSQSWTSGTLGGLGAEGAAQLAHRRTEPPRAGRYCPGCPGCGGGAGSSCRASQALSSAPATARPTTPGNMLVRMWSRASRHAAADAVYQGGCFEPAPHRFATVQGDEQPEPESEVAGADHPSEQGHPAPGPVAAVMRPTNAGASSDTTPMATLPRAKLTATSLRSIARIVRDQRPAAYDHVVPRGDR